MKDLQTYLGRFKDLLNNKAFIEVCCEEVFKDMNMPLSKKDFDVIGGVLSLKFKNPLVRSELHLKKEKILNCINEKIGKKKIYDIR